MKKLLSILFALAITMSLGTSVFAESIDLSALSWEELLDLKAAITLEQFSRDEWQEVEVPHGVYKFGEDIPAGKWTITCKTGRCCYIEYGDTLEPHGQSLDWRAVYDDVYLYRDSERDGERTEYTLDAKEGYYIVIDRAPATFTPLTGKRDLGFLQGGKAKETIVSGKETNVEPAKETTSNESASREINSEPKKEEQNVTVGMKNALKSAKNYLSISGFSYSGLIRQLEFERYSHEEAVYAADNCGADWNEQAVRSAKQYLAFASFSRNGLIKQLEFEGYTNSQASYAADQCGY